MPHSSKLFEKDMALQLDKRQKPPAADKLASRIIETTSHMEQDEDRFFTLSNIGAWVPVQVALAASVIILLAISLFNIDRAGDKAITVAVEGESASTRLASSTTYNDFTEMYDQELVLSMYNEIAR